MEAYDVVIIGAGAAGLATGRSLSAHSKLRVCILEAADYIGGRIKTSYEWGSPIELGAEIIHGDQTITASLAREYGLPFHSTHEDISLVDEDGVRLNRTDRETFYELIGYVSSHGRTGVSVAECIDNNPVTDSEIIKRFAKNSIADGEGAEAESIDSEAFDTMAAVWNYNGGNVVLTGGYRPLLDRLSEGLEIKLNCPVQAIDYSDENGVLVTSTDGREYWAKRVIMTCSLAVLQQDVITFIPGLPVQKLAAITNLRMGNSIKYFVKFKSPMAGSIFQFADADNGSLQTISNWWASVANPSVLVGYCSGDRATRVLALSPERLRTRVIDDLSKIYAQDLTDDVESTLLSRWDNNPFVLGGYSFNPLGATISTRKTLAAPTGNIFWAGEATVHDGGSYATVHGALNSGFRAADEALDSLHEK